MSGKLRVLLMGPPGGGKGTVGKYMVSLLARPFGRMNACFVTHPQLRTEPLDAAIVSSGRRKERGEERETKKPLF